MNSFEFILNSLPILFYLLIILSFYLIYSCLFRGEMVQFLVTLRTVYLVLPVSTAVCERRFSTVKHIKSGWRTSLSSVQLQRLLFLSVEGNSLNIHRWFVFAMQCLCHHEILTKWYLPPPSTHSVLKFFFFKETNLHGYILVCDAQLTSLFCVFSSV